MTETEQKSWLRAKRKELKKWISRFQKDGDPEIMTWDLFRFVEIITNLQRENRRLKTMLEAKCSRS